MKGLSLWQPWASLIALGPDVKPHETRSWATDYRGPLLIHAAVRWTEEEQDAWKKATLKLRAAGLAALPAPTPRGVVVALANLVSCRVAADLGHPGCARPSHPLDRAFGDWRGKPGRPRYAWRLEGVARLCVPIPWAGMQGLWEAHPDLAEQVVRAPKFPTTPFAPRAAAAGRPYVVLLTDRHNAGAPIRALAESGNRPTACPEAFARFATRDEAEAWLEKNGVRSHLLTRWRPTVDTLEP